MQFEITIKDDRLCIDWPSGTYGVTLPIRPDGAVSGPSAQQVLNQIVGTVRASQQQTERLK